jgi:hypothetical protein
MTFAYDAVEVINNAIGRTIRKVEIDPSDENKIRIDFEEGPSLLLHDIGDCCSVHYFRTDDDLGSLVGKTFGGIVERDCPDPIPKKSKYDDEHEIQFLVLRHTLGEVVFSNHNEHNGDYGGFCIYAAEVGP